MPILQETRDAVGANLAGCDSRSLVLERFADPTLKGDERRAFFHRATGKRAEPAKREAWRDFLLAGLGLKPDDLLFAQLQARLMINMAGGVMENAGLCLDRLTGIPCIPGSAVKGCARRLAIQQLLEEPDQTKKVALLVKIARVFGWSELEWIVPKPQWDDEQWKEKRSDFAFACDTAWPAVRDVVRKQLMAELQANTFPDHYAGEVQFLPAYPFTAPSPDLELDVVTCHHKIYYSPEPDPRRQPDKWREWEAHRTAPDTEEPVPVVFPAVAPGHVFIFAVLPGRRCGDGLLGAAKQWLASGLSVFGLGAKTAAGYGWFEVEETSNHQRQALQKELETRKAGAKRAQLQADPAILNNLKSKNEADLRGLVNQFQTDEKFWANQDEVFQLSLLVFCTETDPTLYNKEKANPKSKIIKSLQNLAKKFGRTLP
jgi:CRISPR type III-B/RAMP module RAMP protein Cmr6